MPSSTYLALLRGINLGGKNKIPMKDLAQTFVRVGCGDVRTYIQSGNVVFTADSDAAEAIPAGVTAAIAERFGYQVPVLLRSTDQLREAVRNNPFVASGAPEGALHVMFLAGPPEPHRVDTLDRDRSQPDEFAVRGQEVYLWLPNGVAHSRLTNGYFDSKLATTSTSRNWRTVLKLLDLMAS